MPKLTPASNVRVFVVFSFSLRSENSEKLSARTPAAVGAFKILGLSQQKNA